jgi:cell division initiation protein
MKLTPLDIRHKEFKRGMRGYADTEVDEFLDEIADEFERLFKENIDLNERLEMLEEKIGQYKNLEDTLQKTLVSAQRSAEELKINATKEAQIILQDAELKARTAANEAYAESQKLERQTAGLRNAEEEFRFKFKAMLEGYLKQIATAEKNPVPTPVAATPVDSDFARQAEAIKQAISAEDTDSTAAPMMTAVAPEPQAPPAPPAIEPRAAPVAQPEPPAALTEPDPPEAEEADAPVEFGAAPAFVEAPEAAEAPEPPSAPERVLVGDEDDLLADMDEEVGENEFKW